MRDVLRPTPVAIDSPDGTAWSAAAAMFPEFERRRPAALTVRLSRSIARAPTSHDQVLITPSLLLTPPHVARTHWISATVIGLDRRNRATRDHVAAPPDPRIGDVIRALVTSRVGGHFWAPPLPDERAVTLVCIGADAEPADRDRALVAALATSAASDIAVLTEIGSRRWIARMERKGLAVRTQPHDPWSAIDRAQEIHAAGTHEIALLARLAGVEVRHYGAPPWPAGADPHAVARAWIDSSRFCDPYTGRSASCEDSIALLASWRPLLAANRRIACCVGMSGWKRRRIAAFFHDGTRAPPFVRTTAAAIGEARRRDGAIAAWNSRLPSGLVEAAAAADIPLLRVEDGFVRSVGLGSDFLPPCSIIADRRGIYYDPRQASDLEHLLAHDEFDEALRARAARLIATLRHAGVTKYGAAATAAGDQRAALPFDRKTDQRILLVPGQVADDLSVRLGGAGVRSNLALLRAVRAANPQALILYKPHPDVDAGHRPGLVPEPEMRRYADHVVRGGAMSRLIDAIDEVHTMTSLAGFEALLRGRAVTVYGQPFYAGWGLTHDLAPPARRGRRLSLEELAAAVLILYPRYLDPVTSLPCGPELLISRLADPALWRAGWLMRARQMQGLLRKSMPRNRLLQSWGRRGTRTAESGVAENG